MTIYSLARRIMHKPHSIILQAVTAFLVAFSVGAGLSASGLPHMIALALGAWMLVIATLSLLAERKPLRKRRAYNEVIG